MVTFSIDRRTFPVVCIVSNNVLKMPRLLRCQRLVSSPETRVIIVGRLFSADDTGIAPVTGLVTTGRPRAYPRRLRQVRRPREPRGQLMSGPATELSL